MVELKELNQHNFPTTPEILSNLEILQARLNMVQQFYPEAFIITSGLRSEKLQASLIATGRSTAVKSKHLLGQAADVYDPDGKLWAWCMDNLSIVELSDLWLEDKKSTPTWVHFQSVPPSSGKRIFIP